MYLLSNKLNKKDFKKVSSLKIHYLIYDLDTISNNYKLLKNNIKPATIFYAVKSNSNQKILLQLKNAGASFEVNSKKELQKVLKIGVPLDKIINSAPVKSVDTIKYMYNKGIKRMAYDSAEEADKIHSAVGNKTKLYLRINTSNKGSAQELNTKYGIHYDLAAKTIQHALDLGFNVFGITFSVGSQCSNPKNWEEGLLKSSKLFAKFPTLTTVNVGGGFPIKYSEDVPAIKSIGQTINTSISQNFKQIKPNIFIEPGRFLVANSGTTVANVIGIKDNSTAKWAFVDVSIFSAFVELFELSDFSYPVYTSSNSKNIIKYKIAGPTCDGCDILDHGVMLPELKLGDKIYFQNTGGYTLEYGSPFNGFPMPKSYYISKGKLLLK